MNKIPPCEKYHSVYTKTCELCQKNGRALREKRKEKRKKKQLYVDKKSKVIKNKVLFDETKVKGKQTSVVEGFIYAIENPAWKGWVKIGCAIDLNERLRSYQTSDPLRQYKIILSKPVNHRKSAEKKIHNLLKKVEKNGEWFFTNKDYIANLFKMVEK